MKLGSLIFSSALILSAGVSTVHAADVDDTSCIAQEQQYVKDLGECLGYDDTSEARKACHAAIDDYSYPNAGVYFCIVAEINEIQALLPKTAK